MLRLPSFPIGCVLFHSHVHALADPKAAGRVVRPPGGTCGRYLPGLVTLDAARPLLSFSTVAPASDGLTDVPAALRLARSRRLAVSVAMPAGFRRSAGGNGRAAGRSLAASDITAGRKAGLHMDASLRGPPNRDRRGGGGGSRKAAVPRCFAWADRRACVARPGRGAAERDGKHNTDHPKSSHQQFSFYWFYWLKQISVASSHTNQDLRRTLRFFSAFREAFFFFPARRECWRW